MISTNARQRLRLVMQNTENADEILDALDVYLTGTFVIDRIVDSVITVASNGSLLQTSPIIQGDGQIILLPDAELLVI